MTLRELMVMIAMSSIWALNFVVVKSTVGDFPPIVYAGIRMVLLAVLLSPFLRWRPGVMRRVLTAGVCLGGLNYALLFTGISMASASASAMALELYVPFATMLSVVFLGERVGWRRISGIALAFSGVAIIALGKSSEAGGAELLGLTLVACAGLSEAVGAILIKTARVFRPIELLAWFSVVGAIGLTIAGAISGDINGEVLRASLKPQIGGAILYSALGASMVGHTAYYWLIQRLPISMVTASTLLTAMLAVAFSVILLGEPLTRTFIAGGLLTLVGVGVIVLRNAEKSPQAPLAPQTGAPEPVIFSTGPDALNPDNANPEGREGAPTLKAD